MQCIKLWLPNHEDIIGFKSELRPYRSDGVRLDWEKLQQEKLVFHNYGHGGAGTSLCFGTCLVQYANFLRLVPSNFNQEKEELSILGSGWIGLVLAQILLQAGYKVAIFTRCLPDIPVNQLQQNVQIVSQISGSLFAPVFYSNSGSQDDKTAIDTFRYFRKKISEQNPFVTTRDCYETYDENDKLQTFNSLPQECRVDEEQVLIEFGNGRTIKAKQWKAIVVASDLYLIDLQNQLIKNKSLRIRYINLSHLNDLKDHCGKYIFNCLGLGSRDIFHDSQLVAVKGYHLYFKPKPSLDYFFISNHKMEMGYDIFHIFCRQDRIVFGGTSIFGDDDPSPREEFKAHLLNNLISFKQKYEQIQPQL